MKLIIELTKTIEADACQEFKEPLGVEEKHPQSPVPNQKPLFAMGRIEISDSVLRKVSLSNLCDALVWYQQGEWGDVTDIESDYNDLAIRAGDEIFSRYCFGDATLTIKTDALRQVTNVYSCEEY